MEKDLHGWCGVEWSGTCLAAVGLSREGRACEELLAGLRVELGAGSRTRRVTEVGALATAARGRCLPQEKRKEGEGCGFSGPRRLIQIKRNTELN